MRYISKLLGSVYKIQPKILQRTMDMWFDLSTFEYYLTANMYIVTPYRYLEIMNVINVYGD